ncbi:hypothetical protein JAO73_15755 [Hymenobacter sp. BT523]|uniref:hypothetical protein n=1 Tax=Hymenobacter sp. BT523 TaxID=2795725 RepID=UPI0018EBDF6C|nr:hypothetical protein [Hymenobacter sp. BT523]MBJ6110479.1 hypothetical protein [Hymenobacter sp. BT523]
MADWLLKAKHWQIFLAFAIGYFIYTFLQTDPITAGCVFLVLLVLYVGYYAMLGNALSHYLPRKVHHNVTWFLVDAFVVIIAYAITAIVFDGTWEVSGLATLPIFYLFFAIGHLFWFPAVALVAIETRSEPEFSQYAGTMLQVFFWPIGIWFVQPRLNRIHNAIQADTLDYPRS